MQDHLSGRSRGFGCAATLSLPPPAASPAHPRLQVLLIHSLYRFVTFEEDSAVEKVFTAGTMHELAGKRVEVKTATPRGSGPLGGRGPGPSGAS